ncbi:ketosteroid isomerase-like protein [Chitinophaga sp. W3I9]|uniref:nuclear transport factor 2 family protein n=1 Tax=Chitinophaga sp. W3I9 TaxID=3373924 RepID=UPI003D1BA247
MTSKEIIECYFKALENGGVPKAFSVFAPDARWHQPGNNKFSGVKNGLEEIGNMLGAMMAQVAGSLIVKPSGALMESDNLIDCPVRFTATKGTKA